MAACACLSRLLCTVAWCNGSWFVVGWSCVTHRTLKFNNHITMMVVKSFLYWLCRHWLRSSKQTCRAFNFRFALLHFMYIFLFNWAGGGGRGLKGIRSSDLSCTARPFYHKLMWEKPDRHVGKTALCWLLKLRTLRWALSPAFFPTSFPYDHHVVDWWNREFLSKL